MQLAGKACETLTLCRKTPFAFECKKRKYNPIKTVCIRDSLRWQKDLVPFFRFRIFTAFSVEIFSLVILLPPAPNIVLVVFERILQDRKTAGNSIPSSTSNSETCFGVYTLKLFSFYVCECATTSLRGKMFPFNWNFVVGNRTKKTQLFK